jgi:hypothetical protein
VSATDFRLAAHDLGFFPVSPNTGTVAVSVNAAPASFKYGLQFFPDQNKTLASVRLWCSGTTGSPTAADAFLDVYGDSNGAPGSSLTGGAGATAGLAPSASSWLNWTGLSAALSADVPYWLIFENLDAAPGANYWNIRNGGSNTGVATSEGSGLFAWQSQTYNGTSWGGAKTAIAGFRLGFSDGTYCGLPISNIAASADLAYGGNEWGVKFTSPTVPVVVSGAVFYVGKNGSPPGNLRYRLYLGASTTPAGTTNTLSPGNVTSAGGYIPLHFGSPVTIPASTTARLTVGTTTGGDSSDYYRDQAEYTWDSDSNSLNLLPFQGSLTKTYFNGTSFSDGSNTGIHPFTLLLDTDGEFSASGGCPRVVGSGVILPTRRSA